MRKLVVFKLLIVCLCCATGGNVRGQGLEKSLSDLATNLAKILKGMQQDSVVLSSFSGPPIAASNAGPGISDILKRELEANLIRVSRRAEFGIEGNYVLSSDENNRPMAKIEARIVNSAGAVQVGIDRAIDVAVTGTDAMVLLFGSTATLPPNKPRVDRESAVIAAIEEPQVHVHEDSYTVQASSTSDYGVEIWAYRGEIQAGQEPPAHDYQRCPITVSDGQAIVPLKKADFYAVRLINNSKHDAAVSLSIDGLSAFSFATPRPDFWFVGSGTSSFVYGWYTTDASVDAFQITSYGQSAAKELSQSMANVGVVTATFRAAWPKDQQPPQDELAASLSNRGQGDVATGRGPELKQEFAVVERHCGVIREVVTVRFDR